MAVLEKIRVKFGLAASIIIALGLLSFIIDPSEIISSFQTMSSKFDVGSIAGKSISYNEFQEEVGRMTQVMEMSGQGSQNAQQQARTRDAVWQDMIYRFLVLKNARKAGINVGADEMADLYTGNPSPMIAQNPAFLDDNGEFSKDQVIKFKQNMDSDQTGNLRLYWESLQSAVYNQQFLDKYASLFRAGGYVNPLMVRRDMEENNTTADIEFVAVPMTWDKDSTIQVTDSEIKNYYNSHKKFYKQVASRDIEYVVFEVVPSASDIEAARASFLDAYDEFSTTSNMKGFLSRNSDRPLSERWNKPGDLRSVSKDVEDFVWGAGGPVSGILKEGNKFLAARVLDTKQVPDSAYVRHILLAGDNTDKADSLLGVLEKGGNFQAMAAVWSADNRSADGGELGNIGWLTQDYMIPGFEGVITAPVGKPYILNTAYGTHIVSVTRKSKPVTKKQVAVFEKEVIAGEETRGGYYAQANKFMGIASGSLQNYRRAVDSLGVYSHPVNRMLESSERLGSIENTKEITRWAFENKPGKVSEIKTIDQKYFIIAALTGVHKEGYSPLADVTEQISDQLYSEKALAKKKAEVAEAIKGETDLQSIADKLGSTVSSQSGVAFSSMGRQMLDPAFIGAVASAKEGEICGPVAGNTAVYVFRVGSRETGAFYTEDDAKMRDARMGQYISQMIIPVMIQDADVKDNRARFY